jgi:signal-transduction protein with cAMP-binding, CBS, and nucleotidyltransferase domain
MFEFTQMPFFADITDAENNQLNKEAVFEVFRQDQTPLPNHQVTQHYWFLVEGHWQVWRQINQHAELMFDSDCVGTWTGGIPVIDHIAPVKVTILKPSTLVRISPDTMHQLVATNGNVAKQLLNAVHWGTQRIGDGLL